MELFLQEDVDICFFFAIETRFLEKECSGRGL